jgi:hypothetical protein
MRLFLDFEILQLQFSNLDHINSILKFVFAIQAPFKISSRNLFASLDYSFFEVYVNIASSVTALCEGMILAD